MEEIEVRTNEGVVTVCTTLAAVLKIDDEAVEIATGGIASADFERRTLLHRVSEMLGAGQSIHTVNRPVIVGVP